MKYYKCVCPDPHDNAPVEEIWSEQDILDFYWDYWYEAMVKANKGDMISLDRCIEDWIVVNWAEEVNE